MATCRNIDRDAVIQRYDGDDYVIFREVIDTGLAREAGGPVVWLQGRHPDRRGEYLAHDLVAKDPFWVRLISDDRLLDIAEIFVGPDIALFASHYICKPPFSGRPVLWLAVDEATPENGCLRVVPGTHAQDIHGVRQRDDVENVLGSESAIEIDESSYFPALSCSAAGRVSTSTTLSLHTCQARTSPFAAAKRGSRTSRSAVGIGSGRRAELLYGESDTTCRSFKRRDAVPAWAAPLAPSSSRARACQLIRASLIRAPRALPRLAMPSLRQHARRGCPGRGGRPPSPLPVRIWPQILRTYLDLQLPTWFHACISARYADAAMAAGCGYSAMLDRGHTSTACAYFVAYPHEHLVHSRDLGQGLRLCRRKQQEKRGAT